MACGGCQRRAKDAWGGNTAKPRKPLPPEPTILCPACEIYHTEREYKACPFRLQMEKQKARKHRQQIELEEKQQEAKLLDRRGRQLTPPSQFSQTDNLFNTQSRRKW